MTIIKVKDKKDIYVTKEEFLERLNTNAIGEKK